MTDTTITYKTPTVQELSNFPIHTTNILNPSVTVGVDGLGPAATLTDAGYLSTRVDDSITIADVLATTITKIIIDNVATAENISTNSGIGKAITDSPHPADIRILDFGKRMSDTSVISELVVKDSTIVLTPDSAITSDIVITSFEKVLEDTTIVFENVELDATSNDFLLREDNFFILREDDGFIIKEGVPLDPQLDQLISSDSMEFDITSVIADVPSTSELISISANTSPPRDTAISNDIFLIEFNSNPSELTLANEVVSKSVELNNFQESTIANDVIQLQPNKQLSDSGTTSEVRTFSITKLISDIVGYTENLVLQEFFILREDGTFILREDGTKLYREDLP